MNEERVFIGLDPTASYSRALLSYTLVVLLSSILFLVAFGALKVVAWPHHLHPSPFREFLLAAGAWTVGFALRVPIHYIFTSFGTFVNAFTVLLSTFFQVLSEESLRLAILVLIQLHLERPDGQTYPPIRSLFDDGNSADPDWAPLPDVWDPAFTQVWWIALGWATIDVAVGIAQGYEQLSLYRDVLAREQSHVQHHHHHTQQNSSSSPQHTAKLKSSRPVTEDGPSSSTPHLPRKASTSTGAAGPVPVAIEADEPDSGLLNTSSVALSYTPTRMYSSEQLVTLNGGETVIVASPRDLEAELSHLITRKQRAELEEVYGSPLPRIPIFLIALQRLDSILLSIGLTLLISSAYLRAWYLPVESNPGSGLDAPSQKYKNDWELDWTQVKHTTIPIFSAVVFIHFLLSTLWIEALPRIGVHTASYVGLLVSLATFFAGLGAWGALV